MEAISSSALQSRNLQSQKSLRRNWLRANLWLRKNVSGTFCSGIACALAVLLIFAAADGDSKKVALYAIGSAIAAIPAFIETTVKKEKDYYGDR